MHGLPDSAHATHTAMPLLCDQPIINSDSGPKLLTQTRIYKYLTETDALTFPISPYFRVREKKKKKKVEQEEEDGEERSEL